MNKVLLTGRLTKDPIIKHLASGKAVTQFTLAIDRGYGKEKKLECQKKGIPTADFIKVNAWGQLGDISSKYLSKGKKVLVEGSIASGAFKDGQGQTRYTTDVTASHVEFIDKADSQVNKNNDFRDDVFVQGDFASQADAFDEEIPF